MNVKRRKRTKKANKILLNQGVNNRFGSDE